MPSQWVNALTLADVIGAIVALGLIGSVVLGLAKLAPLIARLSRVVDLILGRPEEQGIPGQPSMVERFERIEARLASLEANLTPNHGSTKTLAVEMQDSMARIAKAVGADEG